MHDRRCKKRKLFNRYLSKRRKVITMKQFAHMWGYSFSHFLLYLLLFLDKNFRKRYGYFHLLRYGSRGKCYCLIFSDEKVNIHCRKIYLGVSILPFYTISRLYVTIGRLRSIGHTRVHTSTSTGAIRNEEDTHRWQDWA